MAEVSELMYSAIKSFLLSHRPDFQPDASEEIPEGKNSTDEQNIFKISTYTGKQEMVFVHNNMFHGHHFIDSL